jgi:predicted transcriptional regulator
MEVHLSPDEEARLAAIAEVVGSNPEQLIKDAALSLLDEDRRFREAVRAGIAQADRGEFIEEAEMDARVDRMFRS